MENKKLTQLEFSGQLMSVPKFCKAYGLKPHAVRRGIRRKIIPAYKFLDNQRWLVKPAEVLAEVKRLQFTEAENE